MMRTWDVRDRCDRGGRAARHARTRTRDAASSSIMHGIDGGHLNLLFPILIYRLESTKFSNCRRRKR
eukprot:SAG31_NODE_25606_length_458_cov_0.757660_2_plen_67_part_00